MKKSYRLCAKQLCYKTAQEGGRYCPKHAEEIGPPIRRYFVSYAYDEGFGELEVGVSSFNVKAVTKLICEAQGLDNVIILYFHEFRQGEMYGTQE